MRGAVPDLHSSYYPPRAGSFAPVRRAAGGLRRTARALSFRLPSFHSFSQTVAALVVPGLVFRACGLRWVARLMWTAMAVALLVFLAFPGMFAGNVAFGILLSAHVISISHVLRPVILRGRLLFQIVAGLAIFVLVSQLIYLPARGWFYQRVAMPLQVEGRTVVVNPNANPAGIARGDWVAYRIEATGGHGLMVRSGFGLGPVLAMPGDQVVFADESLIINGQPHPQPGSTASTEALRIREGTWLIWPDMRVYNHGTHPSAISAMLRELAVVPQNEYAGRPYGRWFLRKQTLP